MNMIRSLFLGVSLLGAVSATANDQIQVRGPGFYHAVEVGKPPPVIVETGGVRIAGYDPETDPPPAVADRLAVPHRAVSGTASNTATAACHTYPLRYRARLRAGNSLRETAFATRKGFAMEAVAATIQGRGTARASAMVPASVTTKIIVLRIWHPFTAQVADTLQGSAITSRPRGEPRTCRSQPRSCRSASPPFSPGFGWPALNERYL